MSGREVEALHEATAALQGHRGALGDALVDVALAPLLARLAELQAPHAPATPMRRLRQVSVLFLDIVGSTRLIQHLEPEDAQSVVDDALAAFAALVNQYGGEVLRYAGDNLKAAFGADVTREDDAERAVACGLILLKEARRRGEAVEQIHGLAGFDARVGIHTGDVVRGGGVEQDNSLSGLAVNIAARMEQAAAEGTLRISMETWRQVQGRFDVLELPALQVRGLEEPMRSFLVQGVRDRQLRGLRHGTDGDTAAMVGRDDELRVLHQLAAAACAPGGGLQSATLIGDAGLGKSRLLAEFQAGMRAATGEYDLWRASSHPQALYQPYGLLRDLLLWHLGVRDSDSQSQAQRTFAAALAPVFGATAEEQTALLGQLVGLDYSASPFVAGILRDSKQLQSRGLSAWVRYLRLQAASRPLVLVLDDLQWADDGSLDALDHLVSAAPDLPIALVCSGRHELLDRRPRWGAEWSGHQALHLSPLKTWSSDALAAALLTRFAEPQPTLQALLTTKAAGNPYFMEALLQMLVDTGVIQTDGAHWRLQAQRLQDIKVPATLVGVLQATLDALDHHARRSLQQASVVGAQFWDEALAAIDPRAPEQLPLLCQRELALPQLQSAFDGAREFSFRHHLLHQVTYGTVLRAEKRAAHGQAARWLQARAEGRDTELASQIAEHFEGSGDRVQAISYWLRAAEDASRRQADAAALAHADRALALDDGDDLQRCLRLHLVRSKVFLRTGQAAEHNQSVVLLESLAEQLDDDVVRLSVAHDRMWRLFMDTRYEEVVALGESRLARAGSRSPAEAARVHDVIFIALARLGRKAEAMTHANQGLELARATGDGITEAAIQNHLGVGHFEAGRMTAAKEHYLLSLACYRAAGSRSGATNVLQNLAAVEQALGRMNSACEILLQVVRESREIGVRNIEGLACANLGGWLGELGDSQRGYNFAREALRIATITGDQWVKSWAHHGVQTAASELGRWSEALEHARAARDGFKAHRHRSVAWINASIVAYSLYALGEHTQALSEVDALLGEVADHGSWDGCYFASYHVYRVLEPLGDRRARDMLAAAHEALCDEADRLAEHVPRETFLQSMMATREICKAWAAS